MDTKRTETTRTYDIVAGPNKDILFDACKYAYNKTAKIAVDFTIAIGYTAPKDAPGCGFIPMTITDITIVGVENEDGSGESFNLHGHCRANLEGNLACYQFYAYYDSKSRKGYIDLTKF